MNVGPRFNGHDIIAITKKVVEAPALKPRSEFESSEEYERRTARFRTQALIGSITPEGHFAFVVEPGVLLGSDLKYDADAQVLATILVGSREKFYLEKGYPEMDTIKIRSLMLDRRKYIGTNAFGVKVEVTAIYSEDYGLAFEPASWVFADSGGRFGKEFSKLIAMSTDEAQRFKPNARILVVCKLAEPWYHESASRQKATIDSPYETITALRFLQVHPEQIWVINWATGEVMNKFSEATMASDEAAQMALRLRIFPLIVELSAGSTASGMLYVRVDDQEEEFQSFYGETKSFNAKKQVVLRLAMPRSLDGLSVRVNGKPYVPNWKIKEIIIGTYRRIDEAAAVITVEN